MEKQKVLIKLVGRKKLFEEYLSQIKNPAKNRFIPGKEDKRHLFK